MTVVRYMLDTNILSHMIRFPTGKAAQAFEKAGVESACVSAIVASEFRFGAAKRGAPRLTQLVEQMLRQLPIVSYGAGETSVYAEIRQQLAVAGTPIGPVDMFIAAHARALDLTLVTDNTREFSRVPGLRVENWLDVAA